MSSATKSEGMSKNGEVSTVADVSDRSDTDKKVIGGDGEGIIDVLEILSVKGLTLTSQGFEPWKAPGKATPLFERGTSDAPGKDVSA